LRGLLVCMGGGRKGRVGLVPPEARLCQSSPSSGPLPSRSSPRTAAQPPAGLLRSSIVIWWRAKTSSALSQRAGRLCQSSPWRWPAPLPLLPENGCPAAGRARAIQHCDLAACQNIVCIESTCRAGRLAPIRSRIGSRCPPAACPTFVPATTPTAHSLLLLLLLRSCLFVPGALLSAGWEGGSRPGRRHDPTILWTAPALS